jgi:hypothetical protein
MGVSKGERRMNALRSAYVMTQFESASLGGSTNGFGDHQNDLRYSAGVVLKFGGK